MTNIDVLSNMENIDEKYIKEASQIGSIFKLKKSFDYFLVGFLLVAVVANAIQFFISFVLWQESIVSIGGGWAYGSPIYTTYEFGAVAGAIKLFGYVCIAIAAEWFSQQNPEIKAMKVVCGLSIVICLCYGAYAIMYVGYMLELWRLQDMYLPVRLRVAFVILKHVVNLYFIIAMYRYKTKKIGKKNNIQKGITVALWVLCIITFLAAMYINMMFTFAGWNETFLTDSFTIVPLIIVVCITKSKRLHVN